MTTTTIGMTRPTLSATRPARTSATSASTVPARRPVLVRWLTAMLEQAQVRRVDNPELANYLAA